MKKSILIITVILAGGLIFAQRANQDTIQDKNALSIELSCDKTEFIQGEPVNVILKIKNNTGKTFKFETPKNYLHNLDKDSTYIGSLGQTTTLEIPPYSSYYYYDNPEDFMLAGTDYSTHTLRPGNYEYYVAIIVGNDKYVSNKINIKINPVPPSLEQAFNELEYVPGHYKTMEDYESLAEKYKGTIYEEIFLIRQVEDSRLQSAIYSKDKDKEYREKALQLFGDFILKYPNTSRAYYLFKDYLYNFEENKVYIEDILKTLIKNEPDCKLLEVLRHQPYYYNKIKYLLK